MLKGDDTELGGSEGLEGTVDGAYGSPRRGDDYDFVSLGEVGLGRVRMRGAASRLANSPWCV